MSSSAPTSYAVRGRGLLVVLVGLMVLGLVPAAYAGTGSRPDPIGQDPFRVGQRYNGDFPDPTVLRANGRYFAYATSTADLDVPVVTGTDLSTWWATGPTHHSDPDALPAVPSWAWHRAHSTKGTVWAPSVAHWNGRFLMAYTVRKRGKAVKMCISTAVSSAARGPFRDTTTKPLVCPSDRGAIDPMLYRSKGVDYLLYKTEDIALGEPTRIWIRQLTADGRAFAEPKPHLLLTADQSWQSETIEAPAMIWYAGHHYLFFSANGWLNPAYSTGYALCKTNTGPCTLPATTAPDGITPVTAPLLVSTGSLVGPGGATPIIGIHGNLRLVYHAWTKGAAHYATSLKCRTTQVGCGQRRMHTATVAADPDGTLVVKSMG
jgi:hypothetical protein